MASYDSIDLNSFYRYLGPVDSLAGYERSYKLVFYKAFFLTNQRRCNSNLNSGGGKIPAILY